MEDVIVSASRRSRPMLAHVLMTGVALEIGAVIYGSLLSAASIHELLSQYVVTDAVIGLALALAGWPVGRYRPRNPIGWLLLSGGLCYAGTSAALAWGAAAAAYDWHSAAWRLNATAAELAWPWAFALCVPLALLLFPDGQLPGRRWVMIAVAGTVNSFLWVSQFVLMPGVLPPIARTNRQFLSWVRAQELSWLFDTSSAYVIFFYMAALVALGVRYRRGSEKLRRQVLWLFLAVFVNVVFFAAGNVVIPLPYSAGYFAIALMPAAITVALLRYQLLDIRHVVSRTVLYVALSACVGAAYLALVSVLRIAWPGVPSPSSSVLATVVIALGVSPVRTVLQGGLERAFFGARRDPVRAVAVLGEQLGELAADVGTGLDGVLSAVCAVLRFPGAALIAGGGQVAAAGVTITPADRTCAISLSDGRASFGELRVALRAGEKRLDPADERVLRILAAPLAVAVLATDLSADLRRSRQRLVTAREEERRRIRRDLHDGLGSALTGVVLKADAARRMVSPDPRQAGLLLAEVRSETTAAIEQIRHLVDDLRPSPLDILGLADAIREQAQRVGRQQGRPMVITVEAPRLVPVLPAAVEVAAYRIATEALTNIARHSAASAALVKLEVTSSRLRLSIGDNGSGRSGPWLPGIGLTSMQERSAELGGTFEAGPGEHGGCVAVTLPLEAA